MKKLILFHALVLSIALFSCGGAGEKKQNHESMPAPDTSRGISAMAHDSVRTDQSALVYVCPCGGCPEIKESKPGKCSKCQLDLVVKK